MLSLSRDVSLTSSILKRAWADTRTGWIFSVGIGEGCRNRGWCCQGLFGYFSATRDYGYEGVARFDCTGRSSNIKGCGAALENELGEATGEAEGAGDQGA